MEECRLGLAGMGFVSPAAWRLKARNGCVRNRREGGVFRVATAMSVTPEGEAEVSGSGRTPHWLGRKHREETKKKISLANKGNTPWNKGRKHSDETRRKIAERTRAAMLRPEMREKMRKVNVGRKQTVETREKIKVKIRESNAMKALREGAKVRKGRVQVPSLISEFTSGTVPFEYREDVKNKLNAYINESLEDEEFRESLNELYEGSSTESRGRNRVGRQLSDETREKLSKKIKEMWADPDYRERVVGGMRSKLRVNGRKPLSAEHRARIRESLLTYNATRSGKERDPIAEAEAEKAIEEKRIRLEAKRKQRLEAREQAKLDRKKAREENKQRELLRIEKDKSLVEVLRSSGALPEPETPGKIDVSQIQLTKDTPLEFPEIHLDFESDNDHVTTVHAKRKGRGSRREDDLDISTIKDKELAEDEEEFDEDYDEEDEDWDEYEEEELLRTLQSKANRSSSPQDAGEKKNVYVYIDGRAFAVDEATGEKIPALKVSER
ncbi:hypothetical protein NDN08_005108 [Rhodosorus marinus]|uniref:Nuclease associated modular domain-containing protein n=1 Tax=Rhodosorus marinus TaxID=101924 RepID=A0AAV8V0X7_9RHOD|nr:hypothetical protein NDN08_005108 [Rhodosorus marinus]